MSEIIEARSAPGNGRAVWVRWGPLAGALLLAAGLRLGLLAAGAVPFNSDEAVVGLMARHILQGAHPVFFYGQAYLGSLDAWLTAGAFALLGQSVLVIRLVQLLLYLGTLATTYWLGERIFGSRWTARAAALLMAIPTVLVTLYTTASLGGYGETLLIGNAVLLLALHLTGGRAPAAAWFALGLLAGLGFWGFPLIGVYLLPAAVLLLAHRPRRVGRWLLAALGFALGAAPWLAALITDSATVLSELGGSAIAGASVQHPVFAVFQRLFYFLLFGPTVIFGLRPPWSAAQFLALPLVPFALALYCGVVVFSLQRLAAPPEPGVSRTGRWLLAGVCLTLIAAFVLTPFGADPSGRYFLPLAAPVALSLADMLNSLRPPRPGSGQGRRAAAPHRRWAAHALTLGVVLFHGWGNVQSAAGFPPGITTQFDTVAQVDQRQMPQLIDFLRASGETRGYTNYWVEFPLAFLSQEELIFAARLPYHQDFRYTPRDNRYPPYSRAVDEAPRAAYITTKHPALDARLREGLAGLGVSFREAEIGDFHVFYALSRKVIPEELGLGVLCCE